MQRAFRNASHPRRPECDPTQAGPMSANDGARRDAANSEVREALREWRRAALAVATTAQDDRRFDLLLATRDEAHARCVEVLNASLRERLTRDVGPRRMTDRLLICDPEG